MKKLILIALIISVAAGIVFAQVDVPGNALTSPQSTATSGRLRSTADNFIRADAYVDVKFNKFYAMMGYQNSPNAVNLGYATKAGDVYIGAYYGGSFWANVPNITYTESNGTWLDDVNKSGVKSYTALPSISGGTAPSNNISVLIGVADMGFRVSLYTNKRLFSDKDFVVIGSSTPGSTPSYYNSYETESGVVTPQLVWSMAKNLTDNGIKPYAALNLAFTKNYTKESVYDNTSGSWVAEESVTDSDINTVTTISAGLGGYTLLNKDGFRFSADLDYVLGITGYDNEYNYIDSNGKNQIKTGFKGRISTTGSNTSFTEESATSHTITPSVSGQWSGGPLAFRFKLNLGVPIRETISTQKAYKLDASNNPTTDGSLANNGTDQKATLIGFNPDLRLAAQWKINPKLALNLGGRINFNTISSTTTEGKTYTNDKENDNSSFKTVATSNPTSITNSLAMGVTFNVTDNLTFEAASGASNGRINVFGTAGSGTGAGESGLLYFTNLLVSLRY